MTESSTEPDQSLPKLRFPRTHLHSAVDGCFDHDVMHETSQARDNASHVTCMTEMSCSQLAYTAEQIYMCK